MKNYEKYLDEIKRFNGDSFCLRFIDPYILKSYGMSCSGISCTRCHMLQMIWLIEDYKEPEEPEVDWGKVKVDTPILVKGSENAKWFKRYFAKYENGNVYTWCGGRTSWTETEIYAWNYAKLAE